MSLKGIQGRAARSNHLNYEYATTERLSLMNIQVNLLLKNQFLMNMCIGTINVIKNVREICTESYSAMTCFHALSLQRDYPGKQAYHGPGWSTINQYGTENLTFQLIRGGVSEKEIETSWIKSIIWKGERIWNVSEHEKPKNPLCWLTTYHKFGNGFDGVEKTFHFMTLVS